MFLCVHSTCITVIWLSRKSLAFKMQANIPASCDACHLAFSTAAHNASSTSNILTPAARLLFLRPRPFPSRREAPANGGAHVPKGTFEEPPSPSSLGPFLPARHCLRCVRSERRTHQPTRPPRTNAATKRCARTAHASECDGGRRGIRCHVVHRCSRAPLTSGVIREDGPNSGPCEDV